MLCRTKRTWLGQKHQESCSRKLVSLCASADHPIDKAMPVASVIGKCRSDWGGIFFFRLEGDDLALIGVHPNFAKQLPKPLWYIWVLVLGWAHKLRFWHRKVPRKENMKNYDFPCRYARRMPDPVANGETGIERHILYVAATDLPEDLPMDPNARVPNIRRNIYRDVRRSLLTNDGRFHLKHKGITIVATSVLKRNDGTYQVQIDDGQGILDGGHSYTLIRDVVASPSDQAPDIDKQFVKVEVVTGVPADFIADMSDGLNTSVQVQEMSLDNLRGRFNWIKEHIENESYSGKIGWRENEECEIDGRDIVSILTCFNIDLFPPTGDAQQPVVAYEKKSAALKLYEDDQADDGLKSYQKLLPILKDILKLFDLIRADARVYWNDDGGSFGKLAFVDYRRNGFELPFLNRSVDYKLSNGALFPMLSAFRWMVEQDTRNRTFRWRGGFANVQRLWQESALELLRMTKQASDELGRNPNAVGKSRNHWANLFARVAMREMSRRIASGS